ncbi:alpha/beta hydrolase [Streptomyces sp. DH41]|uniref:alpha/beta hydrolase n=1 Tax=Streptomyces sp. DH41 TaxID=3040125 RepID=UPI0024416FAD|nr:alpha/beta hydrolase [Streptomyces sp. DH41]MDG9724377.1 alpha/beta hydrolase [Streptomyces sp. DH41]
MTGNTPGVPAPPFDPELAAALSLSAIPATLTAEMLPAMRQGKAPSAKPIEEVLAGVERRDVTIPGHEGGEITVSVLSRPHRTGPGPGIYVIHGGGMITGDRFGGIDTFLPYVFEHDAVLVAVEYRLAPEFPDPYPVEDCFAGLTWTFDNAADLGIDPRRLLIAGGSAGGGLAAGTTLLARDRRLPPLLGQMLMCPMLDDRNETVSSRQIDGIGVWDRGTNLMGWTFLLGERRGTDDVSVYAAPARATDLTGLPPAYIDCGSAEVFRDEDVAYASRIWEAGGSAELHVWSGGFHGFVGFAPHAAISQAASAARDNWVSRLLSN